jgi:cytochrome c oxidase subunit 2
MMKTLVPALGLVVILAACGSAEPDRELSAAAAAGREVALSEGCAACHGDNGEGSIGPAWIGLAGSTVELEGGGTVVADTDYLYRSIVDPQAEVVAGTTVKMPVTELSDEQAKYIGVDKQGPYKPEHYRY